MWKKTTRAFFLTKETNESRKRFNQIKGLAAMGLAA
jgi:hypothetical protein